jgi:hypothetical protein
MKNFAIALIFLCGLGFLGFGLWLVLAPAAALAPLGITASAAGLIELRAFYGGLELGLGVFLLTCAARPEWRRAGLWLTFLGNAGIGLTRIAGIAMSGEFVPFFAYALVWELGFSGLAALCLWRGKATGNM